MFKITPRRHKRIAYYKLTMQQRLEYFLSLPADMRPYDFDKYRKTDMPEGLQVSTPIGKGEIRNKDLFNYLIDFGKGNWKWINWKCIKSI